MDNEDRPIIVWLIVAAILVSAAIFVLKTRLKTGKEPEIKDLAHKEYKVRTGTLYALLERVKDIPTLAEKCLQEFHKTQDMEYKLNLKQLLWELHKKRNYDLVVQEVELLHGGENGWIKVDDETVFRESKELLEVSFQYFCEDHGLDHLINPWELKDD